GGAVNAVTADPLQRIAELPGVGEAVEETRTVVDRLLGHRVLRRRSADVSLESALRGAHASAVLDGARADLEEVRSGAADDPLIKGALRVSGELGQLVEIWRKAPRQVLARLHTLAAADGVGADALGRPRAAGEPAQDPLGLGAAPSPGAVAGARPGRVGDRARRAAGAAPVRLGRRGGGAGGRAADPDRPRPGPEVAGPAGAGAPAAERGVRGGAARLRLRHPRGGRRLGGALLHRGRRRRPGLPGHLRGAQARLTP